MRTCSSSVALLLALAVVTPAHAADPTNMQQASPIPLVLDGQVLATRVIRLDPSLDRIVSPDAKVMVTKGQNYFGVIEGSAWVADGSSGYLLFTDFAANVVYKMGNPIPGSYPCFWIKPATAAVWPTSLS